jgi:uncharacterized protein YggT (Ycf19 family)
MNKIITMLIILILLSSCVKDYDFNPWTTVVNHLIKENYE